MSELLFIKPETAQTEQQDPVDVLYKYLTDNFPGSECNILVEGTDFKKYSRVSKMPNGVIPRMITLTLKGGRIPERLSIIDENFLVDRDGKVKDVNKVEIGQRLGKLLGSLAAS